MSDILDTLRQEGVDPALLAAVQEYRAAHTPSEALRPRIPAPAFTYYGKEVWEQALAAILCGENLLLAGGKATAGRKSCRRLWPPRVGHLLSCKHGRRP